MWCVYVRAGRRRSGHAIRTGRRCSTRLSRRGLRRESALRPWASGRSRREGLVDFTTGVDARRGSEDRRFGDAHARVLISTSLLRELLALGTDRRRGGLATRAVRAGHETLLETRAYCSLTTAFRRIGVLLRAAEREEAISDSSSCASEDAAGGALGLVGGLYIFCSGLAP